MTFPARLTELLEKAGLSLADHAKLKEFLDDHAEALRDLVAAAEKLNYLSKGYSTERESHFIALSEALAKLEEQ